MVIDRSSFYQYATIHIDGGILFGENPTRLFVYVKGRTTIL